MLEMSSTLERYALSDTRVALKAVCSPSDLNWATEKPSRYTADVAVTSV